MAHTARLPAPVSEAWDWQRHAACRGMDENAFFHPPGERGASWREREQRAKEVCDRCPVRQPCLDYSLEIEEPFGTWGGVGEQERWQIVQQRRRADRADRPRPEGPPRRAHHSDDDDGAPAPVRQRRRPRV